MSEATIKGIRDAIQAHIEDKAEEGDHPEFLLEFAVGYATMVAIPEGGERYSYLYILDPHSTPHGSVGLFAMCASQLDIDLAPDGPE